MKSRSKRALVLGLGLAIACVAVTVDYAEAGPFDGKIITSKKRIPLQAKSKKAYFGKLRQLRSTQFLEDTATKQWKIYFAAFFKRPLNDLEVTVKLYDITDKGRHLRASFEQYLGGRGQTSLISNLKLDREQFGVNRQILMTVENRGRVLAAGKFKILGKAESYSGKVDFTEEETKGQ